MVLSQKYPRVRELSFQSLLNQNIADLKLRPEGALRECMIQLRRELKHRHISFFPHFYFGEEPWGCIDRTGSVEIPFFLANNKLRRIAEKYYISYSKEEIMMVLRHEAGHAINYAYKLWIRPDWKKLFGKFRTPYPHFYTFVPGSTSYVRYLHHIGHPHYAQKHPDEDFSETFAVWLDPSSKWKWNYRDWPGALEKLRFIDRLFREDKIADRRPLKVRYNEQGDYRTIDSTIAAYFQIEKKLDPKVKEYTSDLKQIFGDVSPRARRLIPADKFLQNYHRYLEEELVNWIAGADRRDVRTYLRGLQMICALNGLKMHPDQATEKLVEIVIVSTYHILNRLQLIK
jgi:hypothetical protein